MNQEDQEQEKKQEVIRTFKGDVSAYLQKKKISWEELISQKKEEGEVFSFRQRRIIYLLLGFLVFLLVAGGGFFVYKKLFKPPEEAKMVFRPPKSFIESKKLVEIQASSRAKFFSDLEILKKESFGYKNFAGIYLTGEPKNVLGPKEVFNFLEIKPPLSLADTLGKEATLGLIATKQGNEAIYLMAVSNFERAFSAMLRWEPTLALDFRFFIKEEKLKNLEPKPFQDLVIKNQNARFLENEGGEELIGYAIFNRKILIIGFSKEALEIVIEKLLTSPPNI